MDSGIRKPLQGVWNIIRFNWHYYTLSGLLILIILILQHYFSALHITVIIVTLLVIYTTLTSLVVSLYVYDLSDFYKLTWLDHLQNGEREKIINIHAGFDETSELLKSKLIDCELIVADFYNAAKHTEVSIKRARRAYPPFPNTQQVSTKHLPIPDSSADKIFAILSAHEIRNDEERVAFFKELLRILKPSGQVIVTEHLRDAANFLAYNIGYFHFHSKATWIRTFQSSGLCISKEIKTTPFITTFILEKNGTAS